MFGMCKAPMPDTTNWLTYSRPDPVRTCHSDSWSSQYALVTVELKWMCLRRSYFVATSRR